MGCVRIMDYNFLDTDLIANEYASSEQTAFPASNIYNAQRRSKVWRSNGYWNIASSENSLIFRETSGVSLTATITAGEYFSDASFFAEIKSQMEALGGSTYTIERDSTTNKIKFTSDGAGGTGIFELYWSINAATQAFAQTIGFYELVNLTSALTYTADYLRICTEEWIKWDFGLSSNPTAFILIGKRNDPIAINPASTIFHTSNCFSFISYRIFFNSPERLEFHAASFVELQEEFDEI